MNHSLQLLNRKGCVFHKALIVFQMKIIFIGHEFWKQLRCYGIFRSYAQKIKAPKPPVVFWYSRTFLSQFASYVYSTRFSVLE